VTTGLRAATLIMRADRLHEQRDGVTAFARLHERPHSPGEGGVVGSVGAVKDERRLVADHLVGHHAALGGLENERRAGTDAEKMGVTSGVGSHLHEHQVAHLRLLPGSGLQMRSVMQASVEPCPFRHGSRHIFLGGATILFGGATMLHQPEPRAGAGFSGEADQGHDGELKHVLIRKVAPRDRNAACPHCRRS
jgi:hypothetical protein